jgi:hypothetical protein
VEFSLSLLLTVLRILNANIEEISLTTIIALNSLGNLVNCCRFYSNDRHSRVSYLFDSLKIADDPRVRHTTEFLMNVSQFSKMIKIYSAKLLIQNYFCITFIIVTSLIYIYAAGPQKFVRFSSVS